MGEKGIGAERLGELAATSLLREMESGETIDRHAADQILPYLSLAAGPSIFSVSELSSHFHTQVEMIRRFLNVQIETEAKGDIHQVSVTPNRT